MHTPWFIGIFSLFFEISNEAQFCCVHKQRKNEPIWNHIATDRKFCLRFNSYFFFLFFPAARNRRATQERFFYRNALFSSSWASAGRSVTLHRFFCKRSLDLKPYQKIKVHMEVSTFSYRHILQLFLSDSRSKTLENNEYKQKNRTPRWITR